MKKKMSYIILLLVMLMPINIVTAAGFSSDAVRNVCGFEYMPDRIPGFISGLYNIVKLLVPVILIVMGMVDFTKATMAGDEKKMKECQKSFITRLLAAIIIFFIMAVVQFAFRKIATTSEYKNGFVNCIDCLLNNNDSACGGGTRNLRIRCSDYDLRNCLGRTDEYGNSCTIVEENGTFRCGDINERCDLSPNNCPSEIINDST